jgi:limonene-1,2-epoxide hydrolase
MSDNEKTVRAFLAAWPRKKLDELMSYFTDDAVYHNVPVAPIKGKAEIRKVFEGFLGAFSIELIVVNAAAGGNLVFTERIDRFDMDGKRFDLPVNGVFELRGGKIAAFRDYFDLASFERPSGLKL